jgi:hypothetical protein
VPDRRLAWRVGEDGRVEERRERALDRLRAPIGKTSQQRDQNTSRIAKLVAVEIVLSIDERLKTTYHLGSDSECLVAPLAFRCSVDCSRDDPGYMPRDAIRCLGVAQLGDLGEQQSVSEFGKQLVEPASQQRLVEPRPERVARQRRRVSQSFGARAK